MTILVCLKLVWCSFTTHHVYVNVCLGLFKHINTELYCSRIVCANKTAELLFLEEFREVYLI